MAVFHIMIFILFQFVPCHLHFSATVLHSISVTLFPNIFIGFWYTCLISLVIPHNQYAGENYSYISPYLSTWTLLTFWEKLFPALQGN